MIYLSIHLSIIYHIYEYIYYLLDDLSFNKFATQSKTYTGSIYDACNAVDGNLGTCMRTYNIGPNSPDKTVWWMVDLGGIYNIYSINILFKKYDHYYGMLLFIDFTI